MASRLCSYWLTLPTDDNAANDDDHADNNCDYIYTNYDIVCDDDYDDNAKEGVLIDYHYRVGKLGS